MNPLHACRVCHTTVDVSYCQGCYTAAYCLKKQCQKKDWKVHRQFCGNKNESKELAVMRRELCLETIRLTNTAFLAALQVNSLREEGGCIILGAFQEIVYAESAQAVLEYMESKTTDLDLISQCELAFEMVRCAKTSAIPVLYVAQEVFLCFVVALRLDISSSTLSSLMNQAERERVKKLVEETKAKALREKSLEQELTKKTDKMDFVALYATIIVKELMEAKLPGEVIDVVLNEMAKLESKKTATEKNQ